MYIILLASLHGLYTCSKNGYFLWKYFENNRRFKNLLIIKSIIDLSLRWAPTSTPYIYRRQWVDYWHLSVAHVVTSMFKIHVHLFFLLLHIVVTEAHLQCLNICLVNSVWEEWYCIGHTVLIRYNQCIYTVRYKNTL